MARNEERLVVRSYSERNQRIGLVVRIACLLAIFMLGLWVGGRVFESEMTSKRQLEKDVLRLSESREILNQELMNAKTAAEIDRAALEEVRKVVVGLQQQVDDNEEELQLYRNLMRNDDLPKGFSVRELSLTTLDDGEVAYQMVLINKAGALKPVELMLEVLVEGEAGGVSRTIPLHQLDEKLDAAPLEVKFKYFNVVQGIVSLPPGFDPRIVHTAIWKKGQRKKVRKKFNWRSEETE